MSQEFKIDKAVPLPRRVGKYPFAEMEVGDSFYADDRMKGYSAVAARNKRNPSTRFECRKEGEGVRIWRVK